MARGSMIYAQVPYGQADAAFVALMCEILAWDVRADVRTAALMVALWALTRCWPSKHFSKAKRDKWSHKAAAAFQTSERELSELTGFSQKRVHTALDKMQEAGFIVELAPLSHRGEGRGTTPPTYAFRCHMGTQSVSSEKKRTDQSSPAQTWRL